MKNKIKELLKGYQEEREHSEREAKNNAERGAYSIAQNHQTRADIYNDICVDLIMILNESK